MPCRIGRDVQIVEIEGVYGCECLLKSSDSSRALIEGQRKPTLRSSNMVLVSP